MSHPETDTAPDRSMSRTYLGALVVEALVLLALYAISRIFG